MDRREALKEIIAGMTTVGMGGTITAGSKVFPPPQLTIDECVWLRETYGKLIQYMAWKRSNASHVSPGFGKTVDEMTQLMERAAIRFKQRFGFRKDENMHFFMKAVFWNHHKSALRIKGAI